MSALDDPRVFFAAERTSLAWTRTALTLMAFGFAIERFGLFMRMLLEKQVEIEDTGLSFWVGLLFILLGSSFAIVSAQQYKSVLKTLRPVEVPEAYGTNLPFIVNVVVALLALVLAIYLLASRI